jgi:PTH1 family peptidyl-tRNA hydrolase
MDALVREESTKLVVGLGNPGRAYESTRHNVGFMVVEQLRRLWSLDAGRQAFGGRLTEARNVEGARKVLLLEPATYMNLSGQAVAQAVNFHRIEPIDVLVIMDDLDLPLGRIRARSEGSAGGHKGLADVIRALGTSQAPRLRVGIGPPPPYMDAADYVLSTFSPDEAPVMKHAVEQAAHAVELWVRGGIAPVMDKYNRVTRQEE